MWVAISSCRWIYACASESKALFKPGADFVRGSFVVCCVFSRATECHIYAGIQRLLNNFHICYNKDLASRKLADGPYSEECALCYNCGCAMRRASGGACLGMSGV